MENKSNWSPPIVRVDYTRIDRTAEMDEGAFESIFDDFSVFTEAVIKFTEQVITRCENGNYKHTYEDTILMYLEDRSSFLDKAELAIPYGNIELTLKKTLASLEAREMYEKCSDISRLLERYKKLDKTKLQSYEV